MNPKSEFPVLEIVNFILKNKSFKMLEFEAILTLTDSHPLHHMIQPYWLQLGKHSYYIGLSWALKEAFLKYQLKTLSSNRFYKYVKRKHSA